MLFLIIGIIVAVVVSSTPVEQPVRSICLIGAAILIVVGFFSLLGHPVL